MEHHFEIVGPHTLNGTLKFSRIYHVVCKHCHWVCSMPEQMGREAAFDEGMRIIREKAPDCPNSINQKRPGPIKEYPRSAVKIKQIGRE